MPLPNNSWYGNLHKNKISTAKEHKDVSVAQPPKTSAQHAGHERSEHMTGPNIPQLYEHQDIDAFGTIKSVLHENPVIFWAILGLGAGWLYIRTR